MDNQFVDRMSQEIYVGANFLVNFLVLFSHYITNVYIFQDRVVARYEVETAAIRKDEFSSQLVDATQMYLDEVGGVKKKQVYDLISMGSLCLRSQASSSSINIPSTSQPV